jgi:hypothetical protein
MSPGRKLSAALGVVLSVVLGVTLAVAAPAPATPAGPAPSKPAASRIDPSQGAAAKPYMGWSSWSLESTNYPGVNPTGPASWLTEQHVLEQEHVLATTLKSHGYQYVNIDAGWWKTFDANARPIIDPIKFPDGIAYIADKTHADGLKLGIYMPVGLDKGAYGDGTSPIYGAPGCTTGDLVYPDKRTTNGWDNAYKMDFTNPCSQAYITSLANLLASWHVDFLKLDGVGPGSFKGGDQYDNTTDVAAWSKALAATGRPIQFIISWSLSPLASDVWKQYTNGWRIDTDVECYCNSITTWNSSVRNRWYDVIPFLDDAGPGHWNNLDSVDVGVGAMDGITDVERQSEMTLWAVEAAPLYIGDDLTKLDPYGLSLLTNDEVIAVDQAGRAARPVSQLTPQQTWFAANPDGSVTVAQFNLGDSPATVTTRLSDVGLSGSADVRDLWQHKSLGRVSGSLSATLPTHGSRLYTLRSRDAAVPTGLHATAATPSGFTLAWTPPAGASAGTLYNVRVDGRTVATTTDRQATVTGLRAVSAHTFTVTATAGHHTSAPSTALALTTPAAGGRVTYEAEAPDNRLTGGASIGSCAKCSGGKKVGNVGGGSNLILESITVPKAGTYLMTMSYVDGDSSRQATASVNGLTDVSLNLVGTNNNDWDTPQTTTFPIALQAGANWIQIGNPSGYVSDIDAVTV